MRNLMFKMCDLFEKEEMEILMMKREEDGLIIRCTLRAWVRIMDSMIFDY